MLNKFHNYIKMKPFIHISIIIIFIIFILLLLSYVLYCVYNKYRKKELFYESTPIKVLQIGFSNTEKTEYLSEHLSNEDFLLIAMNVYESTKFKQHNINAQLFELYNKQLIDIFYYPIKNFNVLYINLDVFSNEIHDFINENILNSKLEFKIVLLNSSLKQHFHKIISKKYNIYRENIYIAKNIKLNKELSNFINSYYIKFSLA